MSQFYVSDVNPNDGIGGGGCACSPSKCLDCAGPYAVFPGTETDNYLSPHVVVGLSCAKAFVAKAKRKDQILTAGPKDAVGDEPTL